LEELSRKSLDCCKWRLIGSFGEDLENQNPDRNISSKGCVQKEIRSLLGIGREFVYILSMS
jgi:hypothetical protein